MVHVNLFTGSRRQASSRDITVESVLAKIKAWDWPTIRWVVVRLPLILVVLWVMVEGYRILAVSQGNPVDRIPFLDWPLNIIASRG